MFAGGGSVAAALIGARDAKFGRGVIGEESESFLEGGNGLVVVLELRIEIADEIPGVGFVDDSRDMSECVDTFFSITEIFVGEAEVVPGKGVVRQLRGGSGESRAGGLEFLLGEIRDAEIEPGDFELRVGG